MLATVIKAVGVILFLVLVLSCPALAQNNALREAARLDSEQKCGEAERFYKQALAQAAAPSLALLNNIGNHYVLCGEPEKARSYFERVLKVNPQHGNANLQLARLAADRHEGAKALEYLGRVADTQPPVRMLRAEATHWAGKQAAALEMLDGLRKEIVDDPRLVFLFGLTCARIGAYDRAEVAFNAVLAAHPGDFDVLFNLGRAAARAGHLDRAQRALEVALKLRPESVDSLVELAQVSAVQHDYAKAVYLLAQARKLAPQRPEITLALARAAQAGEYYGDAAIAYDEYLRLRPGDDEARRDHALACGRTGTRQAEGLRELTRYVERRPNDPLGHYDLAQLSWRDQPQQALTQLSKAVSLDPSLAAAYVARAWLLNRLGRTEEAVPDLVRAIGLTPRDVRALDQLGVAYSSLDRPADAEKVLRRALAIAPEDPDVLMHLGRALMELGRETEGQRFLDTFQKVRPQRVRGPWKQAGMIEAATLSPTERTGKEIERLRTDAATHPEDAELQFRFAALLLTDGRAEEAAAQFRVLLTRNATAATWQQAGSFLLGFEQYGLARELLERAAAARPAANLDLATAVFFLDGPAGALPVLDRVPEGERGGDYLLLKARILDAAGQAEESAKALKQGLLLATSRPQIGRQAALLLVRQGRKAEALEFLTRAAGADPELLLLKAIVLGLVDRNAEAGKALQEIESQWPEWDRPYVAHGLTLERVQPREALRKLRTAVALGSQDPTARCAVARLGQSKDINPQCSCAGGLYEMLFPPCARQAGRP